MQALSILIVDDNYADRYIMRRMLNEIGLEIRIEERVDGIDAMEYFTSEKPSDGYPPNFTFLDINMPRMGGHDCLVQMEKICIERELDQHRVIMLSSSDLAEDVKRVEKYDFVAGFLVKGKFTKETLRYILTNESAA